MTVKIDGTNTEANPAFTGADTDTGLQCGTDELKLVTGGTARATVDSSGNVGVGGAAAPTSSGYNAATVHLRQASGGGTGTQLRMTTGASGHTASDGAYLSFWGGDSNVYFYNLENANIVFGTNNAERMRILSGGGLAFNGDTAAANALDDYEEGFFTPTLVGSTGGSATSYSRQKGGYVKIGNVVHVYGYLKVSNKGSSISGALKVAGFPFTSKNDTDYFHAPAFGWYTGLTGVTAYGLGFDAAPNSTVFTLARGNGTGVSSLTLGDITNLFGVEWAFTYRTE